MVPQTAFFSDDSDYHVVSYCPFCKPSTNFLLPRSVFALFLSWIRSVVILDLCSCVRSSYPTTGQGKWGGYSTGLGGSCDSATAIAGLSFLNMRSNDRNQRNGLIIFGIDLKMTWTISNRWFLSNQWSASSVIPSTIDSTSRSLNGPEKINMTNGSIKNAIRPLRLYAAIKNASAIVANNKLQTT
jgi:hypothetical protein